MDAHQLGLFGRGQVVSTEIRVTTFNAGEPAQIPSQVGRRAVENDVWDPSTEVEQSPYFWRGHPLFLEPRRHQILDHATAIELFCGAGGTSVGLEQAGYSVVFGADIHRPSVETFRANHPSAWTALGDIRRIATEDVVSRLPNTRPALVVAGVPCQGFSLNNRKRYEADDRNYLFLEFIRFVRDFQPTAVLLENVSGIQMTANGAFADAIAAAIADAGPYDVHTAKLNAADYGVPQIRERVLFVGVPRGAVFSWPQPAFGPTTGRPYRTVGDAISDLPEVGPGEQIEEYTISPTTEYQALLRRGASRLLNHKSPSHPIATIRKIAATTPGRPIYPRFKQRIRLAWDRPSPTQVAGGIRPQYQFGHPGQPRGLTIRERCRIQSFPDTYEIMGGVVQGRVQTGNAVPPLLAAAVGREILRACGGERFDVNAGRAGCSGPSSGVAPVG